MATRTTKKRRGKKRKAKPAPGTCALTGLVQGTRALATWEQAVEEALASGESAVLALVDIDAFGRHLTELGPKRADALLVAVASRLEGELGGELTRVAGDRFGLVLVDTEVEEALGILERARAAVERSAIRVGRGVRRRQIAATVSVGLAGLRRDGGDLRALRVAQGALWRAKSLGGNRCGLADRERMALKTSYYPGHQLAELKELAQRLGVKESVLLREALDDLFLRYKDRRREAAEGVDDAD